jgi:hypothetical protein
VAMVAWAWPCSGSGSSSTEMTRRLPVGAFMTLLSRHPVSSTSAGACRASQTEPTAWVPVEASWAWLWEVALMPPSRPSERYLSLSVPDSLPLLSLLAPLLVRQHVASWW